MQIAQAMQSGMGTSNPFSARSFRHRDFATARVIGHLCGGSSLGEAGAWHSGSHQPHPVAKPFACACPQRVAISRSD